MKHSSIAFAGHAGAACACILESVLLFFVAWAISFRRHGFQWYKQDCILRWATIYWIWHAITGLVLFFLGTNLIIPYSINISFDLCDAFGIVGNILLSGDTILIMRVIISTWYNIAKGSQIAHSKFVRWCLILAIVIPTIVGSFLWTRHVVFEPLMVPAAYAPSIFICTLNVSETETNVISGVRLTYLAVNFCVQVIVIRLFYTTMQKLFCSKMLEFKEMLKKVSNVIGNRDIKSNSLAKQDLYRNKELLHKQRQAIGNIIARYVWLVSLIILIHIIGLSAAALFHHVPNMSIISGYISHSIFCFLITFLFESAEKSHSFCCVCLRSYFQATCTYKIGASTMKILDPKDLEELNKLHEYLFNDFDKATNTFSYSNLGGIHGSDTCEVTDVVSVAFEVSVNED